MKNTVMTEDGLQVTVDDDSNYSHHAANNQANNNQVADNSAVFGDAAQSQSSASLPLHNNIDAERVLHSQRDDNLSDDHLLKSAPNVDSIEQIIEESIQQGIEQQTFDDTHLISIDEAAVNTSTQQTPTIEDDANRLSDLQPSASHHETSVPGIVTAPAIVNPPAMVIQDSYPIKKNEPPPIAVATNVNVNADNTQHTRGVDGSDQSQLAEQLWQNSCAALQVTWDYPIPNKLNIKPDQD